MLILAAACKTGTDKKIQSNAKFDTLQVPIDSATFYFRIKPKREDKIVDAIDSFNNSWYSEMLFALNEPVIKNYTGNKEIYRFTWLRTFHHPISVRLEKQGDMIMIFSKVSNGAGGYHPGKIIFDTIVNCTQKQIDTTNSKLENANFWTLPTESNEDLGLDGSEWIVEVYKNNKYHMVVRWSPNKGTVFRTIGEYLFSISQIKNEISSTHEDY